MRARTLSRDAGFTLIELMVTLAVGGILMGMAGAGLTTWSSNSEHKGARDEVVSVLRVTAERALSEGRTYCLAFGTTGSWQTYRSSCSAAGTLVGDNQGIESTRETVTSSFTYDTGLANSCPTAGRCAYFYPRGTAAAGSVVISRSGKPTYTVRVEQLTSRVYIA